MSPAPPLGIHRRLFAAWERAGVRVCHWKSNEHLAAALAGRTDFDLLVHEDDRAAFEASLAAHGALRVLSPPESRFPGMEDHLVFDAETGALGHLHVHYQLVLGEKGVKDHHLPLEELMFSQLRRVDGVPAPVPELELLLLFLRMHLKLPLTRVLKRWRRSGVKTLQSAAVRELLWLARDVDASRLRDCIAKSGLPLGAEEVLRFAAAVREGSLTTPELFRSRRRVRSALAAYRRRSAAPAAARASRAARPRGKTLPAGGLVLALVGADGSGKSSLTADLADWLGWKLAVERIYLGIPRDAAAVQRNERRRRRLKELRRRRLLRRARPGLSALEARLRSQRWLLVARHRAAEVERARGLASRGVLVLADRFPLAELRAMEQPMDGPRIRSEAGPAALAASEESVYAGIPPPDRAFVLRADLEILRARESAPSLATHRAKVDAIAALPDRSPFETVDVARDYDDVLLDLKSRIWALLLAHA